MALDQSALLEVLEALKAAEVGDRVRAAAETIYQALIEAELTEVIGRALRGLEQRPPQQRRTLPRKPPSGALVVRGVHGDVQPGVPDGLTRGRERRVSPS